MLGTPNLHPSTRRGKKKPSERTPLLSPSPSFYPARSKTMGLVIFLEKKKLEGAKGD